MPPQPGQHCSRCHQRAVIAYDARHTTAHPGRNGIIHRAAAACATHTAAVHAWVAIAGHITVTWQDDTAAAVDPYEQLDLLAGA